LIADKSERLKRLPPYLFREIERKKREVISRGIDIIDLGVGDPDLPTPEPIVEAMRRAVGDPANHRYPSYSGMDDFKVAAAKWFRTRFGIQLDPETEVFSLIGSKEGIAHLPLAFIDAGDVALVPEPAYPVYNIATIFAGGEPWFMPLTRDNGFLPNLKSIPSDVVKRTKLLFISYPNNPTSAVATMDFFNMVVEFAKRNSILVCHDAAYTEMAFDGYKPPSFLEAKGAMDVGIELHSLSKTFNMTGWRIGFAAGNKDAVQSLGTVKSNIDSGVFQAVQIAAIDAFRNYESLVGNIMEVYSLRRNLMAKGLKEAGFDLEIPKATFYLWVRVPEGYTSEGLAAKLLESGVVVTPGNGFGEHGEGYFRIALTQKEDRLEDAMTRIKEMRF
jgi:LL-diaminopimelate aminotransferase